MLQVPIDKIMPVTSARAKISTLVSDVQDKNSMYVLTRGGKPAAILTSIENFKKLKKNQNKDTSNQENNVNQEPKIEIENKKEEKNVQTDTVNSEQPVKISIN